MAAPEPTFWELVGEAFHRKPRLPLLGEVPWNKVVLFATAVLGVGHPGFWLLGLGGEVAYLYLMSTSDRFRKIVRGRRLLAEQAAATQKLDVWLEKLSEEGRARWEALRQNCGEVQRVYETLRPGGLSVVDEARWKGLDQLLWVFLRLQLSLDLLDRQMRHANARALEREIEAVKAELSAIPEGSEALRKSKLSLLDLKTKRLENLSRAAEARQVVSSELQRVEQQVELLREEAVISRDAESLSTRIDSVAGTLSDSDSWMRQHGDILSDLGEVAPPSILDRPPTKETA